MINHYQDPADKTYVIWTDTEDGFRNGRCIAAADTQAEAIEEARQDLLCELAQLDTIWMEVGV